MGNFPNVTENAMTKYAMIKFKQHQTPLLLH